MRALRESQHDVERVVDVDSLGPGAADEATFNHAVANERVLRTKNGADFLFLAHKVPTLDHRGILVLYSDRGGLYVAVSTIVRAIANIVAT
jgi:hypothetical protein